MSEIDPALYRQHVVPVHDLREHEPTLDCWCGPAVDADGVVTHRPIEGDGRAALVTAAFPRYSVNVENLHQLATTGLGVLVQMLEDANPRAGGNG